MSLYIENRKTGRRYTVVNFDKEAGTVTLKGERAEFTEKFDKQLFKDLGYDLKQG